MESNKKNKLTIVNRCQWCLKDDLYVRYHDNEWGVPLHDEKKHFEFLLLESFQAGLSWFTILKKRENFRIAFDNFDAQKIAKYNTDKIEELLDNKGIVRNRLKIEASINNAKLFLDIQKEFGSFDSYIWQFVNYSPIKNHWEKLSDIPSRTLLSDKISADLKRRGFKFVGTTIIYAHLQAIGVVNDHLKSCYKY